MNTKSTLAVSLLTLASMAAVQVAHADPATTTTTKSGRTVSAGNNFYAGIEGDVTWMNGRTKTGGGGGINLGYRFAPLDMGNFRVEAEGAYHAAKAKSGGSDMHYFNYMGNVYYDFVNLKQNWLGSNWHVSPYVGGGIGAATIRKGKASFADTFRDNNTTAFAYQGMAGLTFASMDAPNVEWTLGYKYLATNREEGIKLHANNAELGLRYHF